MSNNMSEYMFDQMPDSMPENMSDRMSKDMPRWGSHEVNTFFFSSRDSSRMATGPWFMLATVTFRSHCIVSISI